MLRKIKVLLGILLLFTVFISCKCKDISPSSSSKTDKATTDMVIEKSYNTLKTMLLVTSFKNDLTSRKVIYYKVLDVTNDEILAQGTFEGTKLVWFTNNKLKGYQHIGIVKKDDNAILFEDKKNNENNFIIIDLK